MTGSANFVQCPNRVFHQLNKSHRLESCLGNLPRPGDTVSLPLYDSRVELAELMEQTQRHPRRKRRVRVTQFQDDARIMTPINNLVNRINRSPEAEASETRNQAFWQARMRSVRQFLRSPCTLQVLLLDAGFHAD